MDFLLLFHQYPFLQNPESTAISPVSSHYLQLTHHGPEIWRPFTDSIRGQSPEIAMSPCLALSLPLAPLADVHSTSPPLPPASTVRIRSRNAANFHGTESQQFAFVLFNHGRFRSCRILHISGSAGRTGLVVCLYVCMYGYTLYVLVDVWSSVYICTYSSSTV